MSNEMLVYLNLCGMAWRYQWLVPVHHNERHSGVPCMSRQELVTHRPPVFLAPLTTYM